MNKRQDPENLRDSLAMARVYLDIARFEGDARYLGHAQSILGPWWDRPNPPPSVLAPVSYTHLTLPTSGLV